MVPVAIVRRIVCPNRRSIESSWVEDKVKAASAMGIEKDNLHQLLLLGAVNGQA